MRLEQLLGRGSGVMVVGEKPLNHLHLHTHTHTHIILREYIHVQLTCFSPSPSLEKSAGNRTSFFRTPASSICLSMSVEHGGWHI